MRRLLFPKSLDALDADRSDALGPGARHGCYGHVYRPWVQNAYNLAFGPGNLAYVQVSGGVAVLDATTGALLGRVTTLSGGPGDIAIDPLTGHALAVGSGLRLDLGRQRYRHCWRSGEQADPASDPGVPDRG